MRSTPRHGIPSSCRISWRATCRVQGAGRPVLRFTAPIFGGAGDGLQGAGVVTYDAMHVMCRAFSTFTGDFMTYDPFLVVNDGHVNHGSLEPSTWLAALPEARERPLEAIFPSLAGER